MVRITRRRVLGLVASSLTLSALSPSAMAELSTQGSENPDSQSDGYDSASQSDDHDSEKSSESDEHGDRTDCAAVTFEPQTTDGTELVVEHIALPDGGYAVVHTLDHGTLGVSAYLPPGAHENVAVELDSPLDSDTRLQVMAHRETTGNETYDHSSECDGDGHYACDGDVVAEEADVTVDADCQ
ncbi:hypothetical protein ACH9L7_09330 [Haloferax sp. S1W]|uniref:DUF7282 domain-containing protein n=1 Tax=Haloferax sp. S1W TaxID=3377110 RepID=UPI0037C7BEC5